MRLFDDYSRYHFILWNKQGLLRRYDLLFTALDFLEGDFEYVLCLKFDAPLHMFNPDFQDLMQALEKGLSDHQDTFYILTQRKVAPLYVVSNDEFIYSFACKFEHFKTLMRKKQSLNLSDKSILFELLDLIGKGDSAINRIITWQLPLLPHETGGSATGDVVIPHKGNNTYLRSLLSLLNQLEGLHVFVGLDQPLPIKELRVLQGVSKKTGSTAHRLEAERVADLYAFRPSPVGPYVIRNWLAAQGQAELIFFQDSDDIPCANRFEMLSSYMIQNEIPLCGSHEIKMDYFSRTVQAVRYPTNVMEALAHGPGHTLLHPSSAITRSAYHCCNRLSEERIFGNDTKFLYHSYFKLDNIRNIDEFLYIRRSHPGSLTTSLATGIGSVIRTQLKNQWVVDFSLVKLGLLKLEDSCLNYRPSKKKFSVKKLF